MSNEAKPPFGPKDDSKLYEKALGIAFIPSALALITFAFFGNDNPPSSLLVIEFLIAMACCFISSKLLFRNRTKLTIVTGVIFIFLNGYILLAFGCGVCINNIDFK